MRGAIGIIIVIVIIRIIIMIKIIMIMKIIRRTSGAGRVRS